MKSEKKINNQDIIKKSQKKIQKGGRIELEFYDPGQCTKDYKLKQKYGLEGILASITYLWGLKEPYSIDMIMTDVLLGRLFINSRKKHLYPFFGLLTRLDIQLALRVSISGENSTLNIKDSLIKKHPELEKIDVDVKKGKNILEMYPELSKVENNNSNNKKQTNNTELNELKDIKIRILRWNEWKNLLQTILKIMDEKKLRNICVGYV